MVCTGLLPAACRIEPGYNIWCLACGGSRPDALSVDIHRTGCLVRQASATLPARRVAFRWLRRRHASQLRLRDRRSPNSTAALLISLKQPSTSFGSVCCGWRCRAIWLRVRQAHSCVPRRRRSESSRRWHAGHRPPAVAAPVSARTVVSVSRHGARDFGPYCGPTCRGLIESHAMRSRERGDHEYAARPATASVVALRYNGFATYEQGIRRQPTAQ